MTALRRVLRRLLPPGEPMSPEARFRVRAEWYRRYVGRPF